MQDSSSGFGRSFGSNRSEGTNKGIVDVTPKKQPTILIKTREPTNEDALSKVSQKEEIKASAPSTKENEGKSSFIFIILFLSNVKLD